MPAQQHLPHQYFEGMEGLLCVPCATQLWPSAMYCYLCSGPAVSLRVRSKSAAGMDICLRLTRHEPTSISTLEKPQWNSVALKMP